jgi:hypothetical protein
VSNEDPFAGPSAVSSNFASLDSFRGRLVLIEPTGYEYDVPGKDDPSQKRDRITATITVVDGSGDIDLYSYGDKTGKTLKGPEFKGVWISQERVVQQLTKDDERGRTHKMVLGRLETYKPGVRAKKGNPWGILAASEEDKQTARDFLANRTIAQSSAPNDDEDPFQKKG